MKLPRILVTNTSSWVYIVNRRVSSNGKWLVRSLRQEMGFPLVSTTASSSRPHSVACLSSTPCVTESGFQPSELENESSGKQIALEEDVEKAIYRCRFMTFLGVWGSLVGSILCFLKGCTYVVGAFHEYFVGGGQGGKIILMLVEAIDIYLIGTVMLVFGMGLYELFISNLNIVESHKQSHLQETTSCGSNLFGLFKLLERPKWLEIQSIGELKTKLGHVIVMVLLIGLFEKSKKVVICSTVDLLCFSVTILLASGCLYLLSKLNKRESK